MIKYEEYYKEFIKESSIVLEHYKAYLELNADESVECKVKHGKLVDVSKEIAAMFYKYFEQFFSPVIPLPRIEDYICDITNAHEIPMVRLTPRSSSDLYHSIEN